jgi:hypothetical protein
VLSQTQIAAVSLILLSWSSPGFSDNPPTEEPLRPTTSELVRHLGDDSFAVREASGVELLRRGSNVKDELNAALKHADLEVQMRARSLLNRIAKNELDQRLVAFIANQGGEDQGSFPGWESFQQLVGSERDARELFAEMIRAEFNLLKAVEEKSPDLSSLLVERLPDPRIPRTVQNRNVSAASFAAIMLAGSKANFATDATTSHRMYSFLATNNLMPTISKGPQAHLLMKLFAGWIEQSATSSLSAQYILLAMRHDLGDAGVDIGRRLLEKKGVSTSAEPYAILLIGKHGTKEEVSLLTPLLSNNRVIQRRLIGKTRTQFDIQVRDVALATIVHLTGQKHKDYGFDQIQPYPMTLFRLHTLGFSDNKQREAAVEKWKTWSAKATVPSGQSIEE